MAKEKLITPPHNIDAEESLLGSLLLDKDALIKVADIVKAEDFYDPSHGDIFASIVALYQNRTPIDLVTLSDHLRSNDSLEKVGGLTRLTGLVNTVPTASHVVNYAEIVRHKATLRRLQHVSTLIGDLAQN